MLESGRTQQIKELIRIHLEQVGARHWKAVRIHCPDISDATFWRYVKEAREKLLEMAGPDTPPSPVGKPTPIGEVPCLGSLPSFYGPLQKAHLYESLLADAEVMRAQAMDHRGKIINWRMFEKSIQLRERLVCQQGEVMSFFQDQEANKQLFAEIVQIVEDLPKEIADKFIDRLHALQLRRLASQSIGAPPGP